MNYKGLSLMDGVSFADGENVADIFKLCKLNTNPITIIYSYRFISLILKWWYGALIGILDFCVAMYYYYHNFTARVTMKQFIKYGVINWLATCRRGTVGILCQQPE